VFLYFDDVNNYWSHSYAGERLAIREFNEANGSIKIDQWFDINVWRPFPEQQPRLRQMFIAHDLEAISRSRVSDQPGPEEASCRQKIDGCSPSVLAQVTGQRPS
jgi:hypothetical protein